MLSSFFTKSGVKQPPAQQTKKRAKKGTEGASTVKAASKDVFGLNKVEAPTQVFKVGDLVKVRRV
jgi:hypothetical protein